MPKGKPEYFPKHKTHEKVKQLKQKIAHKKKNKYLNPIY